MVDGTGTAPVRRVPSSRRDGNGRQPYLPRAPPVRDIGVTVIRCHQRVFYPSHSVGVTVIRRARVRRKYARVHSLQFSAIRRSANAAMLATPLRIALAARMKTKKIRPYISVEENAPGYQNSPPNRAWNHSAPSPRAAVSSAQWPALRLGPAYAAPTYAPLTRPSPLAARCSNIRCPVRARASKSVSSHASDPTREIPAPARTLMWQPRKRGRATPPARAVSVSTRAEADHDHDLVLAPLPHNQMHPSGK
ncbi:hypothetical protein DFH09DRAFT_1087676 [Mycena vulgaris]|nr:hypothetical protein DFH09DRAFT_1087676 [Mycena vulgaris]